jgi:hypothetical protein
MTPVRYTPEILAFIADCRKTMTAKETAWAVSRKYKFPCTANAVNQHMSLVKMNNHPTLRGTGSAALGLGAYEGFVSTRSLRAKGWMTLGMMCEKLSIDSYAGKKLAATLPPPCKVIDGIRMYSPEVCREAMSHDPVLRFNLLAREFVTGRYAAPVLYRPKAKKVAA